MIQYVIQHVRIAQLVELLNISDSLTLSQSIKGSNSGWTYILLIYFFCLFFDIIIPFYFGVILSV